MPKKEKNGKQCCYNDIYIHDIDFLYILIFKTKIHHKETP